MKKIPKEIIEKFIEENFETKPTGDELRINSPFDTDKDFKCYINPTKNMFIDYKAHLQGTFLTFVKEYLNLATLKEAENELIKKYFNFDSLFNSRKTIVKEKIKTDLVIPNELKFFDEELGIKGNLAKKYLNNRGFSNELIKEYKLGYCYNGDFKDRIFIPFFENGKLVYFLTRTFVNDFIRYKNPDDINSKDFVFNIDRMVGDTVCIVEGVFDALTLKHPVATAILSADISDAQCKKIFSKKNISNIIIIPDKDSAGEMTLEKNWKKLVSNQSLDRKINYWIYLIPEGKDINESQITFISFKDCIPLNKSYFVKTLH